MVGKMGDAGMGKLVEKLHNMFAALQQGNEELHHGDSARKDALARQTLFSDSPVF